MTIIEFMNMLIINLLWIRINMIDKKYLQPIKFGLVGVLNTIVGYSVMIIAYKVFKLNYWVSSALNYVIGSIVSFFLNKYFTFESKKMSFLEIVRFIICIGVCYLFSYGIAKPICLKIFNNSNAELIAMLLGGGIFIVCNFLGQKLFVFKNKEEINS